MTKSIALVASEPHYLHHLLPIWDLIPDSYKAGEVLGQDGRFRTQRTADVLLVAGYADVKRFPRSHYIYVEHGAGQSYGEPTDLHLFRSVRPYYSGGNAHQQCVMFLCPNEEVVSRWLARYPDKPAIAVGSPRLDAWHSGSRCTHEPRTVAVTFHWDAQFTGVPETKSAFSEYHDGLPDVLRRWVSQGWHVIGHHHPRYPAVGEFWRSHELRQIGVEYVADAAEVLDRSAILVADNTSMQAEFLSLGRPVIWLNHSDYRPNVEHGGRFWTWPRLAGGPQVDSAASLAAVDLDSLEAPTWHPYAANDGLASQRAAEAICQLLAS